MAQRIDRAAPDLDGLVRIDDGVRKSAKLGARCRAIEIELRELAARLLAGRDGVCGGLQFLDQGRIGFFAVEDRS